MTGIAKLIASYITENSADIEIEEDFYWYVLPEEVYQAAVTPSQLALGQLSDDAHSFARRVKLGEPLTSIDLLHAAALLRYIADKEMIITEGLDPTEFKN